MALATALQKKSTPVPVRNIGEIRQGLLLFMRGTDTKSLIKVLSDPIQLRELPNLYVFRAAIYAEGKIRCIWVCVSILGDSGKNDLNCGRKWLEFASSFDRHNGQSVR